MMKDKCNYLRKDLTIMQKKGWKKDKGTIQSCSGWITKTSDALKLI